MTKLETCYESKRFSKLLLAAAIISGPVVAATDGELSTTDSVGTATINAKIPPMVMITGLNDMDLGEYNPASPSDLEGATTFCVYRNARSGQYYLKMAGDGGGTGAVQNAFQLGNGTASEEIDYSVEYRPNPNVSYVDYDTPDQTTGLLGASSDFDCADGVQARLRVKIAEADARRAVEGDYSGDLVVTVTVE